MLKTMTEYKHDIFGIKTTNDAKWQDHFEVEYDNDETRTYLSKKTFHHDADEDLEFDYKYAIVVDFLGLYEDDEDATTKKVYSLYLVVQPNSFNEDYKQGLLDFLGFLEDDEQMILTDDINSYGGAMVRFGEKVVSLGKDDEFDEDDENILNAIASVYESMDRLRGFYLVRPWNRIGTTGWDTLLHCVNGTDIFSRSLNALKG